MNTTTPQFATLRQKIAHEKVQRQAREAQFAADWNAACAAGVRAVDALSVTPMLISGREGSYLVEGGPCGFAQVEVRPRNSPFAKWLIRQNLGRSSDYQKCVYVWVSDFGQSMQRKEAWADAVAAFLTAKGYSGVSSSSRMD